MYASRHRVLNRALHKKRTRVHAHARVCKTHTRKGREGWRYGRERERERRDSHSPGGLDLGNVRVCFPLGEFDSTLDATALRLSGLSRCADERGSVQRCVRVHVRDHVCACFCERGQPALTAALEVSVKGRQSVSEKATYPYCRPPATTRGCECMSEKATYPYFRPWSS